MNSHNTYFSKKTSTIKWLLLIFQKMLGDSCNIFVLTYNSPILNSIKYVWYH